MCPMVHAAAPRMAYHRGVSHADRKEHDMDGTDVGRLNGVIAQAWSDVNAVRARLELIRGAYPPARGRLTADEADRLDELRDGMRVVLDDSIDELERIAASLIER